MFLFFWVLCLHTHMSPYKVIPFNRFRLSWDQFLTKIRTGSREGYMCVHCNPWTSNWNLVKKQGMLRNWYLRTLQKWANMEYVVQNGSASWFFCDYSAGPSTMMIILLCLEKLRLAKAIKSCHRIPGIQSLERGSVMALCHITSFEKAST